MFSEIINTICVLVSVSLLFLGATTHKCIKQVEEKIDLVMNKINEYSDSHSDSESDSESDSDSDSDSDSESDSDSDSESDIIPRYENETFEFEPFIEKSSSLPDFKDCLNLKKNMSF